MQVLSNGGGVALARLGPRAGLRVPLSPAAALALGTGSSSGGSSGNVSSADDSDGANSSSNSAGGPPHLLLAGVFDGHAGHHTARQAALHLPRLVHAALVREQTALLRRGVFGGGRRGGAAAAASSCLSGAEAAADAAEAALALAFPAFDRWWADARCDPLLTRHGWDDSGSTAVVALLSGERLALANVGDSVALLVRPTGGNSSSDNFVRRLTVLHRADNEEEAARVLSAGGRILSHVGPGGAMRCAASPSASDGDDNNNDEASTQPRPRPRISGMTSNTRYRSAAVTRALGDFAFKAPHPLLTPEPDVVSLRLQQGDDLLLLASDGVTDTLSDEAAAEVALDAARRERKRLEAAIGARAKAWRNLAAAPGGGAGVSDAELARALRQAAARAAADAVVREAHHRGSGDDATCVAIFLDWQKG
jgi:serine/threonine protein phosphatase PrpC